MRHAILVFSLAVFLGGCGETSSPQTSTEEVGVVVDSHARMLQLLEEIKQRTPDENLYLGDAAVRQREAELALLPQSASEKQRFDLHWQLGYHQLRLGNNQSATKHLVDAHGLLSKIPDRLAATDEDLFLFHIGLGFLRAGETENCVHYHTGESCILPIRGSGIHEHQSGTRQAIHYFRKLLDNNPNHLVAQWLLNIAYMAVGEYPDQVPPEFLVPPERFETSSEFPRFRNIAPLLGLETASLAGGTVVDDFDGDRLLDIIISAWDAGTSMRYYRNNGDGTFADRSHDAGLEGLFGGLNLVQADYDNDGDVDIFVLRGAWLAKVGRHPNSLLQNDGRGRFRDVTFEAGLGDVHYPTQAASWADYDLDGDLDLYVGNETGSGLQAPSQLFQNRGDGTFIDMAETAGVENRRYTKGVVWGDYNGDRWPDLYVSNLMEENRLYRNNGDGTFTDVAHQFGAQHPRESFPVWFWDFNNDGELDLYVSGYSAVGEGKGVYSVAAEYYDRSHEAEPDYLFQNDGQGGLTNVAADHGLDRVTLPMGCNFGDLDHDGYPDFYLGTGYPQYEALMPNLMFLNQDGNGFVDVTIPGGFGHLQKGHGVAFADFDHDGDQDVFSNMGGSFAGDAFANVFFENPGSGNHWIVVKLIGMESNRSAIGARIEAQIIENGEPRSVYKWVNSGGSFGANPLRQQIGLGQATQIESLSVFWPTTGKTQRFENVAVDQFLEITEGQNEFRRLPYTAMKFQYREDTSLEK